MTGKPERELPTVQLFLKNIQAEQSRPNQYGGQRGPHAMWNSDWSFPWSQDWWDNWWNAYSSGSTHPCASVHNLLSRKEADGAVVFNSNSKAVYKINEIGYRVLILIQSGKSVAETAKDTTLTESDVELFLRQLLH